MKKNLTEQLKDTITYCMTMLDDYLTTFSSNFVFLLRMLIYIIYIYIYISFDCLLCYLIFIYVTISYLYNLYHHFVIRNVTITLYEHVDVDINLFHYS